MAKPKRQAPEFVGRHDLTRGRPGAAKAPYIELAARFLNEIADSTRQLAACAEFADAPSRFTQEQREQLLRDELQEARDARENLRSAAKHIAQRFGEDRIADILLSAKRCVELAVIFHNHAGGLRPPHALAFNIGQLVQEADARAEELDGVADRLREFRAIDDGPRPGEKANTKANSQKKNPGQSSPQDPMLIEFIGKLKKTVRKNEKRTAGVPKIKLISVAREFIEDNELSQKPKVLMAQARKYRAMWDS